MGQATATREKPILFSGEMVRAILDGKTQTRRVVKKQPRFSHLGYMMIDKGVATLCGPDYPDGKDDEIACPYGAPDDRLWVRETFLPCRGTGDVHPVSIADASYVCFRDGSQKFRDGKYFQEAPREILNWPSTAVWRPSIHMPRWASRITLEITNVRVERLLQITRADALAEGVQYTPNICGSYYLPCEGDGFAGSAQEAFAYLWDSINAKRGYSWESDPWVWVIEFKRITDV